MPRYSFSLENGIPVAHPDATETLPDDQTALQVASKIARELIGSGAMAAGKRIVVRDEAGNEIR